MMKMIMSRKSSFDDAKVRGKHATSGSTTTAITPRHKSETQQQEPVRRRRLSGSTSVSEPKSTRDISTIAAAKETSQPSNVSRGSATVADVTQLTEILERILPLLKTGAYDTTVLSPTAKTLIETLTKQHLDEDVSQRAPLTSHQSKRVRCRSWCRCAGLWLRFRTVERSVHHMRCTVRLSPLSFS